MTAFRRVRWNFALQHAVAWSRRLGKPLLILEALRCDYRWASDRLHRFIVQGMAENQRRLARRSVGYYPYVERSVGAGRGLVEALAARACLVVGDDYPCFFLPRLIDAAARRITGRFEVVDSNGLLPLRVAERDYSRAFDFRRFLQRELPRHLSDFPEPDPLRGGRLAPLGGLPEEVLRRWPATEVVELAADRTSLDDLPIDHRVEPTSLAGGSAAGESRLAAFVAEGLPRYAEARNHPEADATSGLSPYLHFGHLSAHEVFARVMEAEGWDSGKLAEKATGSSQGWWGASPSAESFVDELITWRELGFNLCSRRRDYDQYSSLPDWAQQTLAEHADDPRPHCYERAEFESAATHDPLWNAAQRQLLVEGRIHGYLRMLWGKKILQWSRSPGEALSILIELNNKYALDGRDPNSYSGIFWVLGRYDRPWAPERPIFGRIRYMSSENTARKFSVRQYVQRYAAPSA